MTLQYKRIAGVEEKLQGHQFGLDIAFADDLLVNESEMSLWVPFASGVRRDGVGDLLEIGGIDTSRHIKNPVVLFDHGKAVQLPVGMSEDPDTKQYRVVLDPVAKVAKGKAYFYQGSKDMEGVGAGQVYEHALFCEQLFDLVVKRFIRAGSIGYQVKTARRLPADFNTGTPEGLHLISVLMLEFSVVVMPANADTVGKVLSLDKICGKRLSPYLVKSLAPYAPPRKAMMGHEEKAYRGTAYTPRIGDTGGHGTYANDPKTDIGRDNDRLRNQDPILHSATRVEHPRNPSPEEEKNLPRQGRKTNKRPTYRDVGAVPRVEFYGPADEHADLDQPFAPNAGLYSRSAYIPSTPDDPNTLAGYFAYTQEDGHDHMISSRSEANDLAVGYRDDTDIGEQGPYVPRPHPRDIKRKSVDKLSGGLADDKQPQDFDPAQLKAGIKVEMEHTDDSRLAREIAMDHLLEDPAYYQKLSRMEGKSVKAWSRRNEQRHIDEISQGPDYEKHRDDIYNNPLHMRNTSQHLAGKGPDAVRPRMTGEAYEQQLRASEIMDEITNRDTGIDVEQAHLRERREAAANKQLPRQGRKANRNPALRRDFDDTDLVNELDQEQPGYAANAEMVRSENANYIHGPRRERNRQRAIERADAANARELEKEGKANKGALSFEEGAQLTAQRRRRALERQEGPHRFTVPVDEVTKDPTINAQQILDNADIAWEDDYNQQIGTGRNANNYRDQLPTDPKKREEHRQQTEDYERNRARTITQQVNSRSDKEKQKHPGALDYVNMAVPKRVGEKSVKALRKLYGNIKSQPSDDIPKEKARQILKDGEVQGHPLTEKQRRMFGAAAGKSSETPVRNPAPITENSQRERLDNLAYRLNEYSSNEGQPELYQPVSSGVHTSLKVPHYPSKAVDNDHNTPKTDLQRRIMATEAMRATGSPLVEEGRVDPREHRRMMINPSIRKPVSGVTNEQQVNIGMSPGGTAMYLGGMGIGWHPSMRLEKKLRIKSLRKMYGSKANTTQPDRSGVPLRIDPARYLMDQIRQNRQQPSRIENGNDVRSAENRALADWANDNAKPAGADDFQDWTDEDYLAGTVKRPETKMAKQKQPTGKPPTPEDHINAILANLHGPREQRDSSISHALVDLHNEHGLDLDETLNREHARLTDELQADVRKARGRNSWERRAFTEGTPEHERRLDRVHRRGFLNQASMLNNRIRAQQEGGIADTSDTEQKSLQHKTKMAKRKGESNEEYAARMNREEIENAERQYDQRINDYYHAALQAPTGPNPVITQHFDYEIQSGDRDLQRSADARDRNFRRRLRGGKAYQEAQYSEEDESGNRELIQNGMHPDLNDPKTNAGSRAKRNRERYGDHTNYDYRPAREERENEYQARRERYYEENKALPGERLPVPHGAEIHRNTIPPAHRDFRVISSKSAEGEDDLPDFYKPKEPVHPPAPVQPHRYYREHVDGKPVVRGQDNDHRQPVIHMSKLEADTRSANWEDTGGETQYREVPESEVDPDEILNHKLPEEIYERARERDELAGRMPRRSTPKTKGMKVRNWDEYEQHQERLDNESLQALRDPNVTDEQNAAIQDRVGSEYQRLHGYSDKINRRQRRIDQRRQQEEKGLKSTEKPFYERSREDLEGEMRQLSRDKINEIRKRIAAGGGGHHETIYRDPGVIADDNFNDTNSRRSSRRQAQIDAELYRRNGTGIIRPNVHEGDEKGLDLFSGATHNKIGKYTDQAFHSFETGQISEDELRKRLAQAARVRAEMDKARGQFMRQKDDRLDHYNQQAVAGKSAEDLAPRSREDRIAALTRVNRAVPRRGGVPHTPEQAEQQAVAREQQADEMGLSDVERDRYVTLLQNRANRYRGHRQSGMSHEEAMQHTTDRFELPQGKGIESVEGDDDLPDFYKPKEQDRPQPTPQQARQQAYRDVENARRAVVQDLHNDKLVDDTYDQRRDQRADRSAILRSAHRARMLGNIPGVYEHLGRLPSKEETLQPPEKSLKSRIKSLRKMYGSKARPTSFGPDRQKQTDELMTNPNLTDDERTQGVRNIIESSAPLHNAVMSFSNFEEIHSDQNDDKSMDSDQEEVATKPLKDGVLPGLKRNKRSINGDALLYVDEKDIPDVRKKAEELGLKIHRITGNTPGYVRMRLQGNDNDIDTVASVFGKLADTKE